MAEIDYTQICRVCLRPQWSHTDHLLPIDKTRIHLSTISLTDVLKLFIKYRINMDERLPQQICSSCIKDITAGYIFKMKCETAERFLLKEILNIEPSDLLSKMDRSTSTEDLEPSECNEFEVLTEMPEPQSEPQLESGSKKVIKGQPKETNDKKGLENEIVETVNVQNVFQSYPPTIVSHNEYKPNVQAENKYIDMALDPHTGNKIYNINVPAYTPTDANNYTGYHPQYYNPNYTSEIQNAPIDVHSQYISKIEIGDDQLMDIFENIIEHDPNISENEDTSQENCKEEVKETEPDGNDIETTKAVSSISTTPAKEGNASEKGNIKRKRKKRGPNKNPRPCQRPKVLFTETLDCIACHERHETRESLENHFISQHTRVGFCMVCNKDPKISMLRHVTVHFRGERVECPICQKSLVNEFALSQHLTTNHPSFECPTCYSKLPNKEEYDAHIAEHERMPVPEMTRTEYESKLLCQYCNELFDGFLELKLHFTRMHVDGLHCKVCEKDFNKGISKHINDHLKKDVYRCDECTLKFKRELMLKKHKMDKHNSCVLCEFCLLELNSKKELDDHLLEHEMSGTSGRYLCRSCGLSAISFTWLAIHNETHNEQTYRCTDCFHTFRKEYDYKKHLALKHKIRCRKGCKQCIVKV